MQAPLNETLQSRLDTFHHKFGVGAEKDENRIWQVINLSKPEHERVPSFINGSVIDRFVFDGFYDIQAVGHHQPEDNTERKEARKQQALENAKATAEAVKNPSPSKKLKDKEPTQ